MASLDRHVLLKKLRDVLDQLRGRVAGRNKDDVEDAISMVSSLSAYLFLLCMDSIICICMHHIFNHTAVLCSFSHVHF